MEDKKEILFEENGKYFLSQEALMQALQEIQEGTVIPWYSYIEDDSSKYTNKIRVMVKLLSINFEGKLKENELRKAIKENVDNSKSEKEIEKYLNSILEAIKE